MKSGKIKMKTIQAGPKGVRHRGSTYNIGKGDDEVTAAEAKLLVKGGFAEYETAAVTTPKPGSAEAKKVAAEAKKVADEEAEKAEAEKAEAEKAEKAEAEKLDEARKATCEGCKLLPDNCVGVKDCELFDDAGNPVSTKSGEWK